MTYEKIAGIVAGMLMFSSIVPYLRSIIRGETKPNQATWMIYTAVGTIALLTYRQAGAKETIWSCVVGFTNPIIIFLFSLKYGEKKWTWIERGCVIGASLSLVGWMLFGKALVGLVLCLATDLFGTIPTARKVRLKPWSENLTAWMMFAASCFINFTAIKIWTFGIVLYPVYCLIVSWMITWPILKYHLTGKPEKPPEAFPAVA